MNIEQKILNYKKELDYFDDPMDRYKYLLDQGAKLEDFPDELRTDVFLVSGCQAQVWLVPKYENKLVSFQCDSDAFISKGMVAILANIYGNETPKDIVESDEKKLSILGIDNILTPSRRNGVYSMLNYIKKYAKSYMLKN